ncbi:T9SS type A sorting domain-containing protein [Flavobacteriaceae bacterium S0862]|nr:T9SS type A sorting domain-containing protein [Flavobacteriaceae bacterium S0862]
MKIKLLLIILFITLFSIKSFAQPSNDLCIGSITLPVSASCSNILVTFDGTATDSGLSDPGCANYLGGDLWYALTMPASGIVTIIASIDDGSISNIGMAAYIGSDCNTLTKLSCAIDNGVAGFPEATISQMAGTTIYIRVWEEGNDAMGTFNLCVSEVTVMPPVNNDCSGAVSLTVGAPDTCSNTLVTIDGTETDSGFGDPGCSSYVGGDLWYKLIVPASGSVSIITETNDSSITDGGMAVYTGSDCNNLTLYECDSDGNTNSLEYFERINVYGQTPGEVIYVRVWSYNNAQTGTFNICTFEVSTPPAATNDDCVDAIELTLGVTCSPVLVSNYLATSSEIADPTITDPGCAFYNGNDVWYKLTVPASGRFEIETYESDNSVLDGGMAIYSGTCDPNSLDLIECNDDGGVITTQLFERIELSGRTPGEILFVRVWAFGNEKTGTFNICALQLAPLETKTVIADNFKIYPNPTKGNVYILLKTGNKFKGDVKVFDLSGKLMIRSNNFDGQLDVSKLSRGIYMMSFLHEEKTVTKKLVIK